MNERSRHDPNQTHTIHDVIYAGIDKKQTYVMLSMSLTLLTDFGELSRFPNPNSVDTTRCKVGKNAKFRFSKGRLNFKSILNGVHVAQKTWCK